jgi:hypothetical protein
MKTGLLLVVLLLASLSIAGGQGSKGNGRACISVLNTLNNDEDILRSDTTGRRGLKIRAHADATVQCDVLVAVFTKSGEPIPGCRPQFSTLAARTEVTLPKTGWSWENDTGPIEGYVLFLASGSKEASEIRALVVAMQSPRDDAVLKLQMAKLRELIGKATIDRSPQRPPKSESEVAGTYRTVVGFDWHGSARTVAFSSDKPGAVVFPANAAR